MYLHKNLSVYSDTELIDFINQLNNTPNTLIMGKEKAKAGPGE